MNPSAFLGLRTAISQVTDIQRAKTFGNLLGVIENPHFPNTA